MLWFKAHSSKSPHNKTADELAERSVKRVLHQPLNPMRVRRELSDERAEADLTAPSREELSTLCDRVAEALARGARGPVKTLLQALIHEIRVDSREAIHPIFRVPLGGDHPGDDAVRTSSRSVEVSGLEPPRRFRTTCIRAAESSLRR